MVVGYEIMVRGLVLSLKLSWVFAFDGPVGILVGFSLWAGAVAIFVGGQYKYSLGT